MFISRHISKNKKILQVIGLGLVVTIITLTFNIVFSAPPSYPFTELVSIATDGTQGDRGSSRPQISADGKWVVFESLASNLIPDDTNGVADIFVRDLGNDTTERVSVSSMEVESNDPSVTPTISGDGRYVVFTSRATTLGPTLDRPQILIRDRLLGTTEVVSTDSEGNIPSDSASSWPAISPDGRFVTFKSRSSNLVANDTNGLEDYFIKDRILGTTEVVSIGDSEQLGNFNAGETPAALSSDGRFVAFVSKASNLVDNDTNENLDAFLRDRQAGTTTLVSLTSSGTQCSGSITWLDLSDDANFITFTSSGNYGNECLGSGSGYLRNRTTGQTLRLPGSPPDITPDGQFVITSTLGALITTEISDFSQEIFPSASGSGNELNSPSISSSGNTFAFSARYDNLVPNDSNGHGDIFVHYRAPEDGTPPLVVGVPDSATNANGWYNSPVSIDWQATDPEPSSGEPTDPPDTIANIEGAQTYVSDLSCDQAGNCATGSLTLSIDLSNPAITYVGNEGTYGASEIINITCSADDVVSGIETVDCGGVSGPAYNYLGTHTITATATDKAGNSSTITAEFTVTVSQDDADTIIDDFLDNRGQVTSLQQKIDVIMNSQEPAKSNLIQAFLNEVSALVNNGSLTQEEADILTAIVQSL